MGRDARMNGRRLSFAGLRLKRILLLLLALASASTWMVATAAAAPPGRIVSLAPNLTEILYDLGLEERIAAVTNYCDYPPEARAKPRVGGFANPSLERIVSLRPDWVFMTEDGNPQVLERRLKALGIRTYTFQARRIRDLPGEIRAMGKALGIKSEADRRARRIEEGIRRIGETARTARRREVRSAIFIVQPMPLIAAGKGTAIDDALAILGIDNVAATGNTGYPKYSIEEIIRLGPDALFFGKGRGMESHAKPLIEKLGSLEAVRSRRVYFIDETIYRLGPRIPSALEEMADRLNLR